MALSFTQFPLPQGVVYNGTMGEGIETFALFTDTAEDSVSCGATVAILQIGLTPAALDSKLQAKRRDFLVAAAARALSPVSA